MGSGKRNYRSMRIRYRKSPKKDNKEEIELEKKEIKEEDINKLKKLWLQQKKGNQ